MLHKVSPQAPFRLEESDEVVASILVSGRCNLRCTYCHFYDRDWEWEHNVDISDDLFDSYIELIEHYRESVHSKVALRFSGGEPLVLGDRLFELASRAYDVLGAEIHVLTNGLALRQDVVDRSAACGITRYSVSIENPLEPDKASTPPGPILRKISLLDSAEVRVSPGVVIVPNHHFANLKEIVDIVFDATGQFPMISELTFASYVSPTERQMRELEDQVAEVVGKYSDLTEMPLFPYIVPEYCFQGARSFILELGVAPGYFNFQVGTMADRVKEVHRYLSEAYPSGACSAGSCGLHALCREIKSTWRDRHGDYCALKRAVTQGFLQGIGAPSFPAPLC